ncbi:MAG: enoyl-CoA hydratase/isomerase family protein [Marinibacterium sp.]|nr:enoyl-CoA hydratase/isomerase family protein [Marinibacterium sp.]
MSDINIRIAGRAGRITLSRPHALNALSYDMCRAVAAALEAWRDTDAVDLVVMDATGDKAFCAGGDIAELYDHGRAGNFAYGQQFWRDEYRMNAALADYPKPVVSLMQGFTMGGGVGLGCHGSHRVVGDSSQIAMPECGIGLIPDVGGSLILARAPGRLGDYIGLSCARLGAGDAIHAGFADHFIPQEHWPELIAELETSGQTDAITRAAQPAPPSPLAAQQAEIDALFAGSDLAAILDALDSTDSVFARDTAKKVGRNSPLAMACTVAILRQLRDGQPTIRDALKLEYRYTSRATELGDFLEGIRAQIIDKDRSPRWLYAGQDVPQDAVAQMLAPLGDQGLTL